MATCKYCRKEIEWSQGLMGRQQIWVPWDPDTGKDHRETCRRRSRAGGEPQEAPFNPALPDGVMTPEIEQRFRLLEERVKILEDQDKETRHG